MDGSIGRFIELAREFESWVMDEGIKVVVKVQVGSSTNNETGSGLGFGLNIHEILIYWLMPVQ